MAVDWLQMGKNAGGHEMKLLFLDLTDGFNPTGMYDRPTGGILTSLTIIPKYLASLGHEVHVATHYEIDETVDGVHYLPAKGVMPLVDVAIFNRNVLPYTLVKQCKDRGTKIVWWLHDIVSPSYLPDGTFQLVDYIVALSQYCRKAYSKFYGIPENKFFIIPNGVDKEVFHPGDYEKRNSNLYITASSLIKGYFALDITYTNLKRHLPDLDYRIYSSQSLHGYKNTQEQQKFLDLMGKCGAHVYSPIAQGSMAEIMRQAWCLLMPNSYPEICSNLLLQARASGLPVVASNIGANPEFLEHGKTGLLTLDFHPHDIHCWSVEFAGLACKLAVNKELHREISSNTIEGVPTWKDVGAKWNELLATI